MFATAEFKVGLFVLVCLAIVAAMSFQVNNDPTVGGKGKHYFALLDNANGIVKNSNVRMAGISVGVIREITLDNGKAHLLLNIRSNLRIAEDAVLQIKPNGILGDKYLELSPGSLDVPEIAESGQIKNVIDRGSFDAVLSQVGKIASDINEVTSALKKAATGEGSEDTPVGRIIHNIEDLTADLKDMTGENKDKINETLSHIHNVAQSLDSFINDESDDGFKTNWKKMAKSLARVDSILRNVDDITGKINQGKGTIGKLINDEQTVEELNHAIAGVNNMLDTANKFQVGLDYHSELLGGGAFFKSYVGITIQPGPDRYYLVQVVDDPKGYFDQTNTQQVTGGTTTTTQTLNNYRNRLEFSVEFAKTFYDLTLRAGVIQSAAGFGADYSLMNKKLNFSFEAFNFSRTEGVDVRLWARYKFYSVFYAVVGGDDLLNTKGNSFTGTGAAGFFGLGLDFTNDDLKLLLSKAPL